MPAPSSSAISSGSVTVNACARAVPQRAKQNAHSSAAVRENTRHFPVFKALLLPAPAVFAAAYCNDNVMRIIHESSGKINLFALKRRSLYMPVNPKPLVLETVQPESAQKGTLRAGEASPFSRILCIFGTCCT